MEAFNQWKHSISEAEAFNQIGVESEQRAGRRVDERKFPRVKFILVKVQFTRVLVGKERSSIPELLIGLSFP